MTTEQVLKAVENNSPLLEIIAKTIELTGHSLFDASDLIKGIEAMDKEWDAQWQEALANRNNDYDGRYDDYSSIYPDNFWNE